MRERSQGRNRLHSVTGQDTNHIHTLTHGQSVHIGILMGIYMETTYALPFYIQ